MGRNPWWRWFECSGENSSTGQHVWYFVLFCCFVCIIVLVVWLLNNLNYVWFS